MAILTATEIRRQVQAGRITIDPFNPDQLNPNSYNLLLGDVVAWYAVSHYLEPIDSKAPTPTVIRQMEVGESGKYLDIYPGTLYLGHTVEVCGSEHYVPILDGRSSLARLGVTAQLSAGFGDLGFKGQWTLEITTQHPVRIYAGMPFAQISFHTVEGWIDRLYTGRYQGQIGPTASQLHKG